MSGDRPTPRETGENFNLLSDNATKATERLERLVSLKLARAMLKDNPSSLICNDHYDGRVLLTIDGEFDLMAIVRTLLPLFPKVFRHPL